MAFDGFYCRGPKTPEQRLVSVVSLDLALDFHLQTVVVAWFTRLCHTVTLWCTTQLAFIGIDCAATFHLN